MASIGTAGAGVPVALHSVDPPIFSADLPVFYDLHGPRLDLAVSVRHPQLRFKRSPAGDYTARARVRLKLARKGEIGLETEQIFVVNATDEAATLDPQRFALFESHHPVDSGRWVATVEVEDLAGGAGLGKRVSKAQGILSVPRVGSGGPYLSDAEFRWEMPSGEELPAPERMYGIRQDTLIVYAELYGSKTDTTAVAVRIEDPSFGYGQGDTLRVRGGAAPRAFTYRLPLGSFPEGSYRFTMIPLEEGASTREADFGISWTLERESEAGRNPVVEIKILFEGEKRKRLLALPRSGQLAALEAFWASHDPTPGTASNEVYELFQQRVEHARRYFSEQGTPGPLSARGRVYIRFGPPAQVQIEVLPNDPRDLQEAMVKVHDPTQVDRAGWAAKSTIPLRLERPETSQDLKRLSPGTAITQAAFELWIYDGVGDPLFPSEEAGWGEGVDLRFLFIDSLGTGVYRLESSNLPFRRD